MKANSCFILAYLDNLTTSSASGWAINLLDMDMTPQIMVRYAGKFIAASFANMERNDLKKSRIQNGCAFNINFTKVVDISLLSVEVKIPGYNNLVLSCTNHLFAYKSNKPDIQKKGKWHFEGDLQPVDGYISPRLEEYAFKSTEDLFLSTGWNTGNLIHEHALCRLINSIPYMGGRVYSDDKHILVLTPANQLAPHINNDTWAKNIRKSRIPVCVFGLGSQSNLDYNIPQLKNGTLEWISAIIDNAPDPNFPNISLRGFFTEEVLAHYGFKDVGFVTGCHSFFINPARDLGKRIAAKFKRPTHIAVAAGGYWLHEMRNIERNLIKLVSETNGCYIAQSDLVMVQACRNDFASIKPQDLGLFSQYAFPGLHQVEVENWLKTYGDVFFNVDAWIERLKHFDFVIGSRIHGIVAAIQAEVPAICIAIDSRTRELCEVMKIPFLLPHDVPDPLTLDSIAHLFKFDPEEFDKNRIMLANRMEQFIQGNHIAIVRRNGRLLS